MKTIAFKSLGCKLNQYEVQAMREGFVRHGFEEVPPSAPSDVYILNTCTVTSEAEREARHAIRRFHRLNENAKIVVTGCYAEADADVIRALPGVSMVTGNMKKNQILFELTGLEETREEDSPFFRNGISYFEDKSKAFIKVQDGCNYFCSFCKIPYVRGRLVSRDETAILEEARRLLDAGFRELVLSGVCLGSYGRDRGGQNRLTELLEKIITLPGEFRVRLSSIDPRDTPLAIAELMRSSQKICRHLHLSLQSGSDVILKLMRRGYTSAEYEDLVRRIRSVVPDIGFSTDVIVGYPGEDEAAFEETRRFLNRLAFHHVHLFPYSERKLTRAEKTKPPDAGVIRRRMDALRADVAQAAGCFLSAFVGRQLRVLVESKRTAEGHQQGYSGNYIKCVFPGSDHAGCLVLAVGHEVRSNTLFCSLTH